MVESKIYDGIYHGIASRCQSEYRRKRHTQKDCTVIRYSGKQGKPDAKGPARILLLVIDREPEAVMRALHG